MEIGDNGDQILLGMWMVLLFDLLIHTFLGFFIGVW